MNSRRPEVFISAASADLRTCRQIIKEALLTLGCVPVEQTNFPPDHRTVVEMLRAKIAACDAVIHLAGECYGAEPKERGTGEVRRSYTQLEYHVAVELKKKLYVFVCGENFPFDEHPAEEPAIRDLQRLHLKAIAGDPRVRTRVHSREDLALRVHALQTRVEELGGELQKSRSRLVRGLATGLVAIGGLGIGLYVLHRRASVSEEQLQQTGRVVAAQRDVLGELRARLERLETKNTDTVVARFERQNVSPSDDTNPDPLLSAQSAVAFQLGISIDELKKRLASESGDVRDVIAEIDKQRSASAAVTAGLGRLQRDALVKLGDSEFAAGRHEPAAAALTSALALATSHNDAAARARILYKLASVSAARVSSSTGPDIVKHQADAVASYRAALEYFTRDAFPRESAAAHHGLAIILYSQAMACIDVRIAKSLLEEALAAHRRALEVLSKENDLELWADCRIHLGVTMMRLSVVSFDGEKIRSKELQETGLSALKEGLQAYDRRMSPLKWASAQCMLATLRWKEEGYRPYEEYRRDFSEVIAACESALEICTREADVQNWAAINKIMSDLRVEHAANWNTPPEIRGTLLAAAIAGMENALGALDRTAQPQAWAVLKISLAAAQMSSTELSIPGPEDRRIRARAVQNLRELSVSTRKDQPAQWVGQQIILALGLRSLAKSDRKQGELFYNEAIACLRNALEECSPERAPKFWIQVHEHLVGVYVDQEADTVPANEKARLLGAAAAAYRAQLLVYTHRAFPEERARTQESLGELLRKQADVSGPADAARLRAESVAAFRACLELYPKEEAPAWYRSHQGQLADALWNQAYHTTGLERARLFHETASAYRAKLDAFDDKPTGSDWASTQKNLGNALVAQAQSSPPAEQLPLYTEAAAAYRLALTHYKDASEYALDIQARLAHALESLIGLVEPGSYQQSLFAEALKTCGRLIELQPGEKAAKERGRVHYTVGSILRRQAELAPEAEQASMLAKASDAFMRALDAFSPKEDRKQWIVLKVSFADVLSGRARKGEERERSGLLSKSIEAYRAALEIVDRKMEPSEWEYIQLHLSVQLAQLAERSPRAERAQILKESADAIRSLLQPKAGETLLLDSALLHELLGSALRDQAFNAPLGERPALFAGAAKSYRDVLGGYTSETPPARRAEIGYLLGDTIRLQAVFSPADMRPAVFEEAIAVCRQAVTICSRETDPLAWAKANANLALTLDAYAENSTGKEKKDVLAEATNAIKAAIEIITREQHPREWAKLHNHLACLLRDRAIESVGRERESLLAGATVAAERSLDVINREAMPTEWAMVRDTQATVFREQAGSVRGAEKKRLLQVSVDASRSAREIELRADDPLTFAVIEYNLAFTLREQARSAGGKERASLLAEATQVGRSARDVFALEGDENWRMRAGTLLVEIEKMTPVTKPGA